MANFSEIRSPLIDDKYQRLKLLGYGIFATVYLVKDIKASGSDDMVVKILQGDQNGNEVYIEAFETEKNLLKEMVYNENVIRIHGEGIHYENGYGYPYIVLERLDNTMRSLREIIHERGGLLEEEIHAIWTKLAQIINEAHKKGIAYIDFKSDHVFWNGEVEVTKIKVKLIDWNVSKMVNIDPELLLRRDIFRLGKLMLELLTGINPSHKDSPIWRTDQDPDFNFLHSDDTEGIPFPLQPEYLGPYRHVIAPDFNEIIKSSLNIIKHNHFPVIENSDQLLNKLRACPIIVIDPSLQASIDLIRKNEYENAKKLLTKALYIRPNDNNIQRLLIFLRLAEKRKRR